MATGSDDDPYQGLIPIKLLTGNLISSEFLLEKFLDKAEETLKDVGSMTGVDRCYIKNLVYQEQVLNPNNYNALLADFPTNEMHQSYVRTTEEMVFGPSLYYKAEDTTRSYNCEYHLRTYIDLEINKNFGLSLKEYLDLSVYEFDCINKVAREYLEALRNYREREERSASNTEKNILKDIKD